MGPVLSVISVLLMLGNCNVVGYRIYEDRRGRLITFWQTSDAVALLLLVGPHITVAK